MENRFPEMPAGSLGYSKDQVAVLLENIKGAYEGRTSFTSTQLLATRLELVDGGLESAAVDRVLDWFADILQSKEAAAGLNQASKSEYQAIVDEFKNLLEEALAQKPGERFALVGVFETGYDPRMVDSYLIDIRSHLLAGDKVDTKRLRPSLLPNSKMGYLKREVDEFMSLAISAIHLYNAF